MWRLINGPGHAICTASQEKSSLEPNQLVMLAEAAAKAAEHTALTRMLQQQHSAQRPASCQAQQPAATGPGSASVVSSQPAPGSRVSELPWYKPLAEARGATGTLRKSNVDHVTDQPVWVLACIPSPGIRQLASAASLPAIMASLAIYMTGVRN